MKTEFVKNDLQLVINRWENSTLNASSLRREIKNLLHFLLAIRSTPGLELKGSNFSFRHCEKMRKAKINGCGLEFYNKIIWCQMSTALSSYIYLCQFSKRQSWRMNGKWKYNFIFKQSWQNEGRKILYLSHKISIDSRVQTYISYGKQVVDTL